MLRHDLSILPVFKRLAAYFDPSRQSFAQPVYVLLQASPDLLCLALLDIILLDDQYHIILYVALDNK